VGTSGGGGGDASHEHAISDPWQTDGDCQYLQYDAASLLIHKASPVEHTESSDESSSDESSSDESSSFFLRLLLLLSSDESSSDESSSDEPVGGSVGAVVGTGHVQTLPSAHEGVSAQFLSPVQPATLKPGADPRHVESHGSLHRSALPAASHVGVAPGVGGGAGGGVDGGQVQTLPKAHDGVLVQSSSPTQPATLKPGADPRQVDSHGVLHSCAFPAASHEGVDLGGGGGGGTSAVGGHVQTLPSAHEGVSIQSLTPTQPAFLKPGVEPLHVDSHGMSHRSALPASAHEGAPFCGASVGGGVGGGVGTGTLDVIFLQKEAGQNAG